MNAELERMVIEMENDPDLLDYMKEQYAFYQSMKGDFENTTQEMEENPEFFALIDSFGEDYSEKVKTLLKSSKRIHRIDNGLDPKRHRYKFWIETLYRIDENDWFLHGKGGSLSKYAISAGGTSCGWEHIFPMTRNEARIWLVENSPEQEITFFPE